MLHTARGSFKALLFIFEGEVEKNALVVISVLSFNLTLNSVQQRERVKTMVAHLSITLLGIDFALALHCTEQIVQLYIFFYTRYSCSCILPGFCTVKSLMLHNNLTNNSCSLLVLTNGVPATFYTDVLPSISE